MAPGDPTPRRTLYVGAALAGVGGADPHDRAILVDDDRIAWTGAPDEVPGVVDAVVDLGAAWLTPGFVDAHVHATMTGLQARGVPLGGARSVGEVLDAVRQHAARTDDHVIVGAGWDDHGWPEGRPPSAAELAQAAPGRMVVLLRVDGHSCVVDAQTLDLLDLSGVSRHVHRGQDGRPSGWLLESANEVAQRTMRARLPSAQLQRARAATCELALSRGITTIHEMGIPGLTDRDDALTWATGSWPITVHAYWASLELDPSGVLRPGGDLFLDGSIGSCTAATAQPYRTNDGGTTTGELFCDEEELVDFYLAATRAGLGAGVHAIGDRAVAQTLGALRQVARRVGPADVRAARHRIEHAELIAPAEVAAMAALGVVASVQPGFDATWNGPGGLYEHRFGRARADQTNPLAAFADAGVAMCFSSDSPVLAMDPWAGVVAAERHHGGLGIDRATALTAATIGGHHVVRQVDEVGALRPGRRADLVAWPGDPLVDDPTCWEPVAVITRGRLRR